MSIVELFLARANRLFVDISDEFELVFSDGLYNLQDQFKPSCHFLEVCLLGRPGLTGKKLKDIAVTIQMSSRWVAGFYYGFKSKKPIFRDSDFNKGVVAVLGAKNQILSKK